MNTKTNSDNLETVRIKLLFEHLRESVLAEYAWLVILFAILLISEANVFGVAIWGCLVLAVQIADRVLFNKFFRLKELENPLKWERYLIVSVLVDGTVISAGIMMLVDISNHLIIYVTFVLIMVPAFISATSLVASIKLQYYWITVLLVPIAIKSWTSGEPLFWFFGGAIVFAGIPIAVLLGRKIHQDFIETLRLRFENKELLETVQAEKERAEKANTDKSRFLAATSHDLRQPLHALELFLGGLKNRLKAQGNIELLMQAQASSGALRELLNALLDVSRLDAGDVKSQKQIVSLSVLLQESCAELASVAEAKGLKLRLRNQTEMYIETDPVLLLRVLRNFISNAIRYTDKGGILIGARRRSNQIQIEVWDTGKGIKPEQQQYVFDEYYQIDNPERDSEKGLGLGLSIVRKISKLLGHNIGFHSRVNCGSCFYIKIPVSTAPITYQTNRHEQDGNVLLTGLFVLVIDDHKLILEGVRGLLRDWDCEVLVGKSLGDILQELTDFDYPVPNVLLVDYRLHNNETGDAAIQELRAFFKMNIPAILMTGEAAQDLDKIAQKVDAKLVRKPISAQALNQLLQQVKRN